MTLSAEHIIERNVARNFWCNVLDNGVFTLGISMVSRYTVLPFFIEQLTDARWVQGLIPSLYYTGWLLPGLFMAPFVTSLPRRKPLIMYGTIGERIPFLVLGILLLSWQNIPAPVLLGLFFALYTIHAFSAGFCSMPWQDFISRVIPGHRWGMFFGMQQGFGGVFGVVGATIASAVLAAYPFPQSIGILALACFGAMIVSYGLLGSTVEPPQATIPRQPIRAFLSGVVPLLKRDHGFRRYLLCRTAIAFCLTGHSFVTATAIERFHIPNATVGGFTAALLAAQAISSLGLGTLADRWGHKQVLELATGLGMLALLLAIIAPTSLWFYPIFVLVGAAQSGYLLSGFTLVYSFSTPDNRPTYIGVANTALAPIAALGPLLSGALASVAGYQILFGVLIVIGIIGAATLHWRVATPSRTTDSTTL